MAICAFVAATAGGSMVQVRPPSPGDPPAGGAERAFINVPVDGTWFVLDELMNVGDFYAPIFTYSSDNPVQIDITDLFVVSDRNEVYLDFALVGATPAVPDWPSYWTHPIVDNPQYTDDPAVAWLEPAFSKSSFALPAGTHTLTFRNIHIPPNADQNGPFDDGTMAFRLVPEPSTLLLAVLAGATALLSGRRRRRPGRAAKALVYGCALAIACWAGAGAWASPPGDMATAGKGPKTGPTPVPAVAGGCGANVQAAINGSVLEITGTESADTILIRLDSGAANLDIFEPITSLTPDFSFDVTSFTSIKIELCGGNDIVVFDDTNGVIASQFTIEVNGGDGNDIIVGGVDLTFLPLDDLYDAIDTLQTARDLIEQVLDLLDDSQFIGPTCDSAPCLVNNMAESAKRTANDLILPTAHYVRDVETELVQPAAAAVRDVHDRAIRDYTDFLENDARPLTVDAYQMKADVEVLVDEFELLLPLANDMLARAQTLYVDASNLGLLAQNGDGVLLLQQTIESHVAAIVALAGECIDPDDPPNFDDGPEENQDPSGLPGICAEVERRIEALEALLDEVEKRNDAEEGGASSIEGRADAIETDGDSIELAVDGEEGGAGSFEDRFDLIADDDETGFVAQGEAFEAAAALMEVDYEAWSAQLEADLEARGDNMEARGLADVQAAADALEAQIAADVEAPAAAIRAQAETILTDLDALMAQAATLLGNDIRSAGGAGAGCQPITTQHTFTGGAGNDVLVGTVGSDLIEGGDDEDLLIGVAGDDVLKGGAGIDLIFGGAGNDEIHGGTEVDLLIGNSGDDCIYGGGGQTLSRGNLSVELGDLFFGGPDNDSLIAGDDENDETHEDIDLFWGRDGDDKIRAKKGGTLTIGSFSIELGCLAFGGDGDDDIVAKDGIDVIFGDAGEDTITTGKGAQLTIGSGSNEFRLALGDLVFGGDDADTIHGDDPDADRADDDIDFIFGGEGGDTISGYGGGNLSIGDSSDPDFELKLGNLIFGRAGTDTITTLDGIDVIFGGDDGDTVTAGKGALLSIGDDFRLALGDLIFGGGGQDTLHGDDPDADRADDDIDVIFGGDDGDTIHGYGGGLLSIGDESDPDFELKLGNVIFGGDGNDEIDTLDGIDVIFCGPGDDTAEAGKGHVIEIDDTFKLNLGDFLFGGPGDDTLHGDAPDPPEAGEDEETLDGIDVIFGATGEDKIYGGGGGKLELPEQNFCLLFGNLLFGGPDNDELRGDYANWDTDNPIGGIDLILGGVGDDLIEGAGGSLIILGDLNSLQVVIIWFGNIMFGGPGDDTIKGADEVDLCQSIEDILEQIFEEESAGPQSFVEALGGAADLIFAGPGNDTVDSYNGIDFVFGGVGDDVLRADHGGIVIVPISGVPVPIAFGNLMFGADGVDTISSRGRLVTLAVPPIEIDLLFGGPCIDDISAGDGFNIAFGGLEDDTIDADEGINLLFGNRGDDDITAGHGLNIVFGNRGDDDINTGSGLNVLFGNRGNDHVQGASGVNVLFGNRDDDVVLGGADTGQGALNVLFGNRGNDEVTGGAGLTLAFGNRGKDVVRGGNGLAILFGNGDDDDVTGGNGVNIAFGNKGHDIIETGNGLALPFGNRGEDRLTCANGLSVAFGNRDNDILVGGGTGLFIGFGNGGEDVVAGGNGLSILFGNAENDFIFGAGDIDIAFGNRGDDKLYGFGGKDFLFGNKGNDCIDGGSGGDFLFGNADNDRLVSGGEGDFLFGNRGSDEVRSGSDGSCDWLFGNRGNDDLYRCQAATCDRPIGGRGRDTKNADCNGLDCGLPNRGEVRGRVMLDMTGDGIGDMPHVGLTVTAGSFSAVTADDGTYRIAGLNANTGYTVALTVPADFVQVSAPATYSVNGGPRGIDLHRNRDFVTRPRCYVSNDAWSCAGNQCSQPGHECRPVLVRRVMRCVTTGAICGSSADCPCETACEPSWAIEECSCDATCWIDLDPATGPSCSSICLDGTACQLIQDGDLFYCGGCPEPCTPLDGKLFEGFENVAGLPAQDWHMINNSQPLGTTGWSQGIAAVVPACGGSPSSYIFANSNSGAGVATISNWLITPPIMIDNGGMLSFCTRTLPNPAAFADRLQVRMSTACCSTHVGDGAFTVGDFTTVLLDINPMYDPNGYPPDWSTMNVLVTGLPGPTCGRFAFRYFVEDGGPMGSNSNFVGLDTVNYLPPPPPITEPCDCPGDLNQDNKVNGQDIQAFVDSLLGDFAEVPGYSCADMDGDAQVTTADIGRFVQCLTQADLAGGPCPCASP